MCTWPMRRRLFVLTLSASSYIEVESSLCNLIQANFTISVEHVDITIQINNFRDNSSNVQSPTILKKLYEVLQMENVFSILIILADLYFIEEIWYYILSLHIYLLIWEHWTLLDLRTEIYIVEGWTYIAPAGTSGVSSLPFRHQRFLIWFLSPFLVAETC